MGARQGPGADRQYLIPTVIRDRFRQNFPDKGIGDVSTDHGKDCLGVAGFYSQRIGRNLQMLTLKVH